MKVGETIPVTIAGQNVAQAVVKELADGTVTLEFPATRVVMAVRTQIAPEVTAAVDDTGTSAVIDEVVRESAAVVENPENPETPATETPVEQNSDVVETSPVEEKSEPAVDQPPSNETVPENTNE